MSSQDVKLEIAELTSALNNKVDLDFNNNARVISTGSIEARTLQDRFSDVINVKDFGAVGDGIHDDSDAIQSAIDFAATVFKSVFIPKGSYYTTKPLCCREHTTITGLFKYDARFTNSVEGGTFYICGPHVKLQNITIETNDNENAIAILSDGDHSGLILLNVDILGGSFNATKSKCFKISGNTWHTLLIDNCVWDCGCRSGYAVEISGNSETPQNADCHITNLFLDTFHIESDGGCIKFTDIYAALLNYCRIRTTANGTCICTENSTNTEATRDLTVLASYTVGGHSLNIGENTKIYVYSDRVIADTSIINGDLLYSSNNVIDTDETHIRYYNGLQICWGGITVPANSSSIAITFRSSFIDPPKVTVSAYGINWLSSLESVSTTGCTICRSFNETYEHDVYVNYIAIGRWY